MLRQWSAAARKRSVIASTFVCVGIAEDVEGRSIMGLQGVGDEIADGMPAKIARDVADAQPPFGRARVRESLVRYARLEDFAKRARGSRKLRIRDSTEVLLGEQQIAVGFGKVWFGDRRLAVRRNGVVQSALIEERLAAIIQGFGIVWPERQRAVIARNRLPIASERGQGIAAIVVRLGVGRIERQSPVKARERLVRLAQRQQRVAAVVVGLRVSRAGPTAPGQSWRAPPGIAAVETRRCHDCSAPRHSRAQALSARS